MTASELLEQIRLGFNYTDYVSYCEMMFCELIDLLKDQIKSDLDGTATPEQRQHTSMEIIRIMNQIYHDAGFIDEAAH